MQDARERAGTIRLLVLDVDGVLTDGRLLYGPDGLEELKAFHVRDGHGIKRLLAAGIEVAIVSGRHSSAVDRRMKELGVERVHQGCEDKLPVFRWLLRELRLEPAQVACIGDDVPDLPLLEGAGLAVAPADAHPALDRVVHLRTRLAGGRGAVREVCDLILDARQGKEADPRRD